MILNTRVRLPLLAAIWGTAAIWGLVHADYGFGADGLSREEMGCTSLPTGQETRGCYR